MAETTRYKILAKTTIPGGGIHVIYSNTTANRQTVVTDIFLRTNDTGARAYLLLNAQRIQRVVPAFANTGWRYPGLWIVLEQGDELKLETIGPTPPKFFTVFVFGLERDNTPAVGTDTYRYKTTTGQIAWTSGAFPPTALVTMYTAPVDTILLIHSLTISVDNPNRWVFELVLHDLEFHRVENVTDTNLWVPGRRDAGKIMVEPGGTLKIRATFAAGVPTQALIWWIGGVERHLQP